MPRRKKRSKTKKEAPKRRAPRKAPKAPSGPPASVQMLDILITAVGADLADELFDAYAKIQDKLLRCNTPSLYYMKRSGAKDILYLLGVTDKVFRAYAKEAKAAKT